MPNKVLAVLRLTRIEHSIMLVIAVLAAEFISSPLGYHIAYINSTALLLSVITPIFISMSSFAINDIFDVKTDRQNHMAARPIVSGAVTKKEAKIVAIVCMLIGIGASAFINMYAFVIAIIFGAMAFLYSYKLKEVLLAGNAYIALSMAIPFIFGDYVVSSTLNIDIIMVVFVIFLSGLAREIHGMIRDYKGDIKIRKSNNVVKYMGAKRSSMVAMLLYIEAITISIFLFFFYSPFAYNIYYIVPIIITDCILLYVAIAFVYKKKKTKEFLSLSRNISLAAMSLALLAFLISPLLHLAI